MTHTTQLTILLLVAAVLCGFSYYPDLLAPINELAKALSSAKP